MIMNNAWCDRSVQLFYCERLQFWNNSERTFQSYRYKIESIIVAHSSVITLTGYVNSNVGLDSMRFSMLFIWYCYLPNKCSWHDAQLKCSLHITPVATVYFVNLTIMQQPTENGKIDIGTKATVVFKKYRAKGEEEH